MGMSGHLTPGQAGSLPCIHCGSTVFFVFSGGPHKVVCQH